MPDDAQGRERGMDRFVAFGDAVFAFAITLLALDLRLPAATHYASDAALRSALFGLLPQFGTYALSFFVVGQFWIAHHRKFVVITRYDAWLIRIDMVMLLFVVMVPSVTALLRDYTFRSSVTLYAATMAATPIFSALVSFYAVRRGFVERELTAKERRLLIRDPAMAASVFVLSAIVAQWNVHAAMWCWLLLIPASFTPSSADEGSRRREDGRSRV
jgi:uncharacterized membrane protein